MSLGGPREEKDKSGSSCTACDVAINTVWFEDVMYDSIAFTTFVVNIAMEGTTRILKFLSTNVFGRFSAVKTKSSWQNLEFFRKFLEFF